jgi:hypothetical protein
MKHFINSKLLKMSGALALSLVVIGSALAAMFYGSHLIENNFVLGSILIGLSPLVIFCTAFFYQRKVICPMRQIFIFAPTSLNKWQKMIVKSAENSYSFSKWVPIVITGVAAIEAIGFIPNTIGRQVMTNGLLFEQLFAAVIISANIVLFFKMVDQIVKAKESLEKATS